MLVEVGRPNRQPGIIDDPDLGVSVQRAGESATSGRDRRSQETTILVVSVSQHP
jgi:hypothetical protein